MMPSGSGEEASDVREMEKEPLCKKIRFQGPLGEGWEKVTPEKPKDVKEAFEGPKRKSPRGNSGPCRFLDLGVKQRKISDFLVALAEVEESSKAPKPREPDKVSTTVRKKVKKFEDLSKAKEEVMRSPRLRSLKKVWDKGKVGSKVQIGIIRFLMGGGDAELKP